MAWGDVVVVTQVKAEALMSSVTVSHAGGAVVSELTWEPVELKDVLLYLVRVVGTGGGAITCNSFTVEIFVKTGELERRYRVTGCDGTAVPSYGLFDAVGGLPLYNEDSPKTNKVYVKITNDMPGDSSDFDILLQGVGVSES